eukprot:gene20439-14975_t
MGDEEDYQSDGLTQDDLEEQLMDDVSLDMDVDDDVGNDLDADEGLDQSTVASSVDGGDGRKFRDTTSQFMQASQVSVSAKKGRERSNAKPVECLDMEGNLIKVYNSGTLAARDLNVQQGAYQTTQPTGVKLKRGFAYVAVEEPPKTTELTQRTTRASRGEYGLARVDDKSGRSVLAPPSIKARTWRTEEFKAGPFSVTKWVPNAENPTEELQALKPKLEKRRRGSSARKSG